MGKKCLPLVKNLLQARFYSRKMENMGFEAGNENIFLKCSNQKEVQFSSVQSLSLVRLFATPWMDGKPPCPSPTPGIYPNSWPLSRWCHPGVKSLLSPFPPAFNLSKHQGLFKWVSSSHQMAKVLEFQLHHQSFQWTP